MANIIAVVWDFDKTLVDGYMQDPIFEEYNVESKEFWKEVNTTGTLRGAFLMQKKGKREVVTCRM